MEDGGGRGRRGFRYVDARGNRITDPGKLARIEALVIPPAWREVRISARPSADRQATGLDAAGRRQYLYREDYRAAREQEKYDRLIRFAERLPELRAVMSEHMELGPYEREWVAAVAVRLIDMGWLRVGSDRYARESRTYGITTLTKRHVAVPGSRMKFLFRGKHRVLVRTQLVHAELADAIRNCSRCAAAGASSATSRRRDVQPHGRAAERLRDPAVIEQYLDGRTIEDFRPRHLRVIGARDIALDQEEQALLSLLRSWRIRRARAESEAA
jgi:DNA topoisomerase IB